MVHDHDVNQGALADTKHDTTLLDTLPAFYRDALDEDDNSALREFVNVLQMSLTSLNETIKDTGKPVLRAIKTGQSGFEHYTVSDVVSPELKAQFFKLGALQQLQIGRVFATGKNSWLGAKRIVEILYPKKQVRLEEGRVVKRFLPTNNMTGLQGSNALGTNSVLGYKLEDRMNRCRFYVSSLNNTELKKFGSDRYVQLVGGLLKQYVEQPIEMELVLVLAAQTQKTTALGQANQAILGAKTWLSAAIGQEKELVFKL